MDNDAAHHANIALHMYLNRDFVNLIDNGKDYLDKPHLHFWLCAISYKIFGVTSFAYKFPSLLFSILGVYSTFRLGRILYNREIGKLAALILASAFAFMLANSDVRMDAILTACIAFASWQGVEFVLTKKIENAIGLAFGLALGFSTKGHIAAFTPAVGILFYILFLRDWKIFTNWKWLIVIICFGIFIFPVVCCYYLQFNLHPEKIVRNKDHINGVKFILFGQSVERFSGESFGNDAKHDYLFFFHSFLWAFAPWSILAFLALVNRIKYFTRRNQEWLTTGTIVVIALLLTFSGFKLPHYLNIIFPAAAILVAAWLANDVSKTKAVYIIQLIVCAIVLLLIGAINTWAFPVEKTWVTIGVILLLAVVFYFFLKKQFGFLQKAVAISSGTMVFVFFLLNTSFYPQLLNYQAGNMLAKKIAGNLDASNVYFWKDNFSSSFNFYTATERKQFDDSLITKGKKPIWLLFDKRNMKEINEAGYNIGYTYTTDDYEISKLQINFIDPATRKKNLSALFIGELTVKQ
jgi:4-amino-4-deoxy-L-arabinose transferase-like glycosyltransferase